MVKVPIKKLTHLGVKADYSIRKTDLLLQKNIKNITSKRPLI